MHYKENKSVYYYTQNYASTSCHLLMCVCVCVVFFCVSNICLGVLALAVSVAVSASLLGVRQVGQLPVSAR